MCGLTYPIEYDSIRSMENQQILVVKQNNKLVLSNMLRQYVIKGCMGVLNGWDVFLVKSGRISQDSDDITV